MQSNDFDRVARIFSKGWTVFTTNGFGETRHPHTKEWHWMLTLYHKWTLAQILSKPEM